VRDTLRRELDADLTKTGSENPENSEQKGGRKCTKSNEKVKVGNRTYVVYLGSRGGKYVRMGGKYVSLASMRK